MKPLRWIKRGLAWCPDGAQWWARSHATCPTPLDRGDGSIRIYVQCRDEQGIGRVGYVDVAADDPARILGASNSPCLDIGPPGTFDENGVLQTSVLPLDDGRILMYYVGFELGTRTRYRLLTGLAVSEDGGDTFRRTRNTPILERSDDELFFRGGPFVIADRGVFRMWYLAGSAWTEIDGKPMPCYDLRYIESADGVTWPTRGRVVLPVVDADEHGFGRPWVVREPDGYRLFFSVRRRSLGQYRLGYAESIDGLDWTRRDAILGLDVSPAGFDDQAIMYSAVVSAAGRTWMFYNGNQFGQTGFGFAEAEAR
jgi:hypothetical protein